MANHCKSPSSPGKKTKVSRAIPFFQENPVGRLHAREATVTHSFDNLPASGFMRQPQVLEVVPFSSATLWRKCKAGQFPKPVKLSERVTAWRVGAIKTWLEAQADGEAV